MIDRPDSRGVESRERVAYVCVQLDRIRAALEAHGCDGAAPLERVLAALGDGEETTAPLDALHEALLVAGDAAGINGRVRGLTPHGVDPGMPDEWVLLCPMQQCSRYAWPSGPELPRCTISGLPLYRERV